jgi:hypothetical protein
MILTIPRKIGVFNILFLNRKDKIYSRLDILSL